jgi:hypothetical protein
MIRGWLPPPRYGVGKTLGLMLLLGVVVWWCSIWAIPPLVRRGIPEATATQLPFFAFGLGAVVGFAMRYVTKVRRLVAAIAGAITLGAVLWFFGLFVAGLLLSAGAPDWVGHWIPRVCFWGGLTLGALGPLLAAMEFLWRGLR